MTELSEQQQHLEKLLLSEDLEELTLKANKFNIFNVLKLQNAEIRHSNFLSWLMTPYENHGLRDYFLKEFLKEALKRFSCHKDKIEVLLKDLAFLNLDNAEVKREFQNIDIFIVCPATTNKFLCIIENKVWTSEHDDQLRRYAKVIKQKYCNYKKLYIYLSPEVENNFSLIEKEPDVFYIPMSYRQVYDVITKVLKFKSKYMNNEIRIFIEQYKGMIERNIMKIKDKELVELCRKIYRENQMAINLIIDDLKNASEDIGNALIESIKRDNNLILEDSDTEWIRFIPKSIDNKELNFAESDWVDSNKILMIEINNKSNQNICADIIIRQAENTAEAISKRDKLLKIANERFGYKSKNKKYSYAHIFSIPLVNPEHYYDILLSNDSEKQLQELIYNSNIIKTIENLANEFCK